MIEVSYPISESLLSQLEEYFFETEDFQWSIIQKLDDDPHILLGYFSTKEEAMEHWKNLRSVFSELPENPDQRTLEDEDWKSAYKKYLKPWHHKSLHWVPIWQKEEYSLPKGDVALWVDAGMAFGTGTHETTQLCAQSLIDYYDTLKDGEKIATKAVIDAGCGSGILALSASLLGFKNIYAFDFDPDTIHVSKENSELNNLKGKVTFEIKDIKQGLAHKKADLILANILANVLCENATFLINAINPGGRLVLSGILNEEAPNVISHFKKKATDGWGDGFKINTNSLGEWSSITLIRT